MSLFTGNADLAEELAQETIARICRDWHRVRGMDAPGAWAHRTAMNLANSHFRRVAAARRATERSGEPGPAPVVDVASTVAVRYAVAELPGRQRQALVLRYYADLSVSEVAAIMGCPDGTVKTLTRGAIVQLRDAGLLDDEDDKEDLDAR